MRDGSRIVSCALLATATSAVSCAPPQSPGAPSSAPVAMRVRDLDTTTANLPLATTRVLRFTTSEGTWMSVDVAPDGATLVFDLLGDLYTLSITGGQARRLTAGPAIDAQPRYSPDGAAIVFTSDRDGSENVWLINADGSAPRPVTRERHHQFQSPIWTPGGDSIVVARRTRVGGNVSHLRLYPWTGGAGREVPRGASDVTSEAEMLRNFWQGPAFGPDPRFLWHTRFNLNLSLGHWHNQLARHDRITGRDSALAPLPGGRLRPVLSPDGRWLVYGTPREGKTALILHDLISGAETVLVPEVTRSAPYVDETRDAMPGSAFTPDSKSLIITNYGKFWRVAVPSGAVTPIPFTAKVEQHLGPLVRFTYPIDDSAYTVREIRDARFSPDGKRVAFTAIDRLWVLDWPDGQPRRLTDRNQGERYPAWSPDGQYLAFVSWEEGEMSQAVYRARSDGSAPAERLTQEPGHYGRLDYTPDGQRIVASRTPIPGPSTYPRFAPDSQRVRVWLPATGGPARINDGRRRRHPELSPDGRYALHEGREEDLTLIPRRGTDSTTTTDAPAAWHVARLGGDFAGWSDDGRSFYYTLGTTVFRMPLRCVESLGAPPADGFLDDQCEPERRDIVLTVPPDRARGTIALRGAKLVTMRGTEVIEDGDLLIRGGRIVAIGPRGHVDLPRDVHVVDVTGKVILPGLIDVHSHARGLPPHIGRVRSTGAYQDQAFEYLLPLAYGVTTQRDPQAPTEVFGHADLQAVGSMLAPRMFPTGPGIGSNWSADDRFRGWGNAMPTPARTVDVLTRFARFHRATQVKEYRIGDRRTRQWFNMAARELGVSVTSEGGRGDLKAALARMLDGYAGHEHFFAVAPLYEDVRRLLAASGIVYTPTLVAYGFEGPSAFGYYLGTYDVAGDPRLRHLLPTSVARRKGDAGASAGEEPAFLPYAKELPRIAAAGGRLAVGGHGSGAGLDVHFELWAMASGGLAPHAVLRAATLGGAEALGRERDLGSLEPGKLADLIVLEKDPLEDIRHSITVRYVMQNGRLYDSYTMDELWPRQRPLPRQWWLQE